MQTGLWDVCAGLLISVCVWGEGGVIVWRVVCVCTWDAFALDGLSDDGQWLVARLTQHLAQLLHTVAVHDDGLPAAITQHRGAALHFPPHRYQIITGKRTALLNHFSSTMTEPRDAKAD